MISGKIKTLEANDERQYMIHENYEVYVKQGAPLGAASFHYHNFYEIIYVIYLIILKNIFLVKILQLIICIILNRKLNLNHEVVTQELCSCWAKLMS